MKTSHMDKRHPASRAFLAALREDTETAELALVELSLTDELERGMLTWIDTMHAACGVNEYSENNVVRTTITDVDGKQYVERDLPEHVRLASRLVACRLRNDREGWLNVLERFDEDQKLAVATVFALLHMTAATTAAVRQGKRGMK